MREERRPMRRPTRPLSLEVALHMCQAASSGSEVKLWTPMCWDLALYVARLEAFADSITDREAALRIAGATGPLGDPEVSGDGAPGATDAEPLVNPDLCKLLRETADRIEPSRITALAETRQAARLMRDAAVVLETLNATQATPRTPAHSKSEYKRRVAQGDPNVLPPADGVDLSAVDTARMADEALANARGVTGAPAPSGWEVQPKDGSDPFITRFRNIAGHHREIGDAVYELMRAAGVTASPADLLKVAQAMQEELGLGSSRPMSLDDALDRAAGVPDLARGVTDALPFDREYVSGYLSEVLAEATGNADPEVQKLLAWLADGVEGRKP